MENEFWQTIDEADSLNYGEIASYLKNDLKKMLSSAVEESPEIVRQNIGKAADNLYTKMDEVKKVESTYGPAPGIWKKYGPEHENIKQNLSDLKSVQDQKLGEEVVKQTSEKTVSSIDKAGEVLNTEYQKYMDSQVQFRQELDFIKKSIVQMEETLVNNPMSKEQYMKSGAAFLEKVEEMRNAAQKTQTPSAAEKLLKETRTKVTNVYQVATEMPGKIKDAIKYKTYGVVDRIVQKTASYYDKAIVALELEKQKVLNLSPLKDKTEPAKKIIEQGVKIAAVQEKAKPKFVKRTLQVTPAKVQNKGREKELSR